jgi:hypothetical protein
VQNVRHISRRSSSLATDRMTHLLSLLVGVGWSLAAPTVTLHTPMLVANRTGERLFFPLLQHSFGNDTIMLRAQTTGDATGSAADPNQDAVFVRRDLGDSWQLVEYNDPVQKRMCVDVTAYQTSFSVGTASIAAVADTSTGAGTSVTGTSGAASLCIPYSYTPMGIPPPPTPSVAPACLHDMDRYCNDVQYCGPDCIYPQAKEYNRSMTPYYAVFGAGPTGEGAAWRCYSHEATTPDHLHWSRTSKTPSAFCSGTNQDLVNMAGGCKAEACPVGHTACAGSNPPLPAPPAPPQYVPAFRNGSLWVHVSALHMCLTPPPLLLLLFLSLSLPPR